MRCVSITQRHCVAARQRQLRSAANGDTEPHRRCAARACGAVGLLVSFHRGHRHRRVRLPRRDDLLRHLGLHRALLDDAGRIHDRRVADIHAQAAGPAGTAVPRIDRCDPSARGFRLVSRVPATVDRNADRWPSRLCKRVPRPPMAQRALLVAGRRVSVLRPDGIGAAAADARRHARNATRRPCARVLPAAATTRAQQRDTLAVSAGVRGRAP